MTRRHCAVGSVRDGGPTLALVEIECADCGCIVDLGVRLVPCRKPECCCRHLPSLAIPSDPRAPGHDNTGD